MVALSPCFNSLFHSSEPQERDEIVFEKNKKVFGEGIHSFIGFLLLLRRLAV